MSVVQGYEAEISEDPMRVLPSHAARGPVSEVMLLQIPSVNGDENVQYNNNTRECRDSAEVI